VGTYLIVYATYLQDLSRGFLETLGYLSMRLTQVPIALCLLYAKVYTFEAGARVSKYYVHLLGGQVSPIANEISDLVAPGTQGNAPAGILGSAFPNIPTSLHGVYFLFFIVYVFAVSRLALTIRIQALRILITILFGLLSWFILLTDPLTAMWTYGLLPLGLVTGLLGFPRASVQGRDRFGGSTP
jgi:hypothetical protein